MAKVKKSGSSMVINLGPAHTHPWSAMKLGKALGFLCGVSMLAHGIIAWKFGYGMQVIGLLADVLPGVDATPVGVAALAGWGALHGFVGGYLLAWLYNKM